MMCDFFVCDREIGLKIVQRKADLTLNSHQMSCTSTVSALHGQRLMSVRPPNLHHTFCTCH